MGVRDSRIACIFHGGSGMKHIYKDRLRARAVQPGNEVLGRLWPSSTLKELMERKERDFLHRQIVTAQGTMVLNW